MEKCKDPIFLLSREEYEKAKGNIPWCLDWWWLRSAPASYPKYAFIIRGLNLCLHIKEIEYTFALRPGWVRKRKIGKRFKKYDTTWIVVSKDLAISERPIGYYHFDTNRNNNYKTSEVRQYLLRWLAEKERSEQDVSEL